MTLIEEKELKLIKKGLTFDSESGRWIAKYPWIKEPSTLPENRYVAYATLKSTERRIKKNPLHEETYQRQIDDMLERRVAREVSGNELKSYKGPKFYISHHDVLRPDSHSTAMRIVFNSSARVNGVSLNDCLAKGPSLLNNMLGILLRFRQEHFAFIGDISKMFHSIGIPLEDQMMHLFPWRKSSDEGEPRTYAMTAVNMGDRPAAAIAQTALRETALEAKEEFPEASSILVENSYMDDIPGRVVSEEVGQKIMTEVNSILEKKGFKIKDWTFSGQSNSGKGTADQRAVQTLLDKSTDDEIGKVLGMGWDSEADIIKFTSRRISGAKGESTKRECLSTIYSIYDPLGILTPVTVAAKIILRKIWAARPHIDWDVTLPSNIQRDWDSFRKSLLEIGNLSFTRSIKPKDGDLPVLVIFSDRNQCHARYGAGA
jgi:hypothetical protein